MSLANLINPTSGTLKPGVWKRHNRESDEDENNHDSNVKKSRYWYVTLESDSPTPTDDESSNESIYSIQDEETEFARDTSDTSTSAWISTSAHHNMELQVEYDVASASESDNPFLNVSSSDPEIEDYNAVEIAVNLTNSELELDRVEDTDASSLTSVDSEISRADYWTCIQCNTTNNNPLFRYCEKCYQLRKNFFPPRPKRKKRRPESVKIDKIESETASSLQNNDTLSRTDSGFGSQSAMSEIDGDNVNSSQQSTIILSQDSNENDNIGDSVGVLNNTIMNHQRVADTKVNKSINDRTMSPLINKELKQTELESSEFIKSMELMKKKLKSNEDNDNKFCLVCTVSPKNGAFVHGNVSHICCCYRCAVKVWKTTKHCPICQRKVTNVLKAFYV